MRLTRRKPVALCVLSLSFVLLLFAEPSQATISRVHSTAGQITTGTGSITVPATTAGNLLVVQVALFNGTPHVSSVTDGGDTFVLATNSRPSDGQVETWYCLNSAGGKTSVTVTANSSVTMDVAVNEYQAPGATWSFDIANSQTRQSATTTPTSPTLTTTASNDVVVSLITSPAGVTGCVSNLGQTFNLVNTFDGEGYLDLLNVPAGTYQAKCNLSASQIYESDIAAFVAGSGGGGGGAITYIQSQKNATSSSATSLAATFSTTPTAGDTIVVGVDCFGSTNCITSSITDSAGNSYAQIGPTAGHGGTQNITNVWLYCASGIATGSNFTVTAHLTDTGSSGDSDIYIAEYSGVTCGVDQSATGSLTGGTATTLLQTSSVTTTNGNDLLIAIGSASTGNAATGGSGYTLRQNDNGGTAEYGGLEDRIVSATGSYSGSMTIAVTTTDWAMVMVALKGASGGGGGAPTITSFTPTSGPVGTSVNITGTNFTGVTAVKFNGSAAQTFNFISSTQITATVPPPATTGPISVTTPSGTGTSTTNFTVTTSAAPTITSLSPISGFAGYTLVTISGSFGSAQGTVLFGSTAATVNTWTASSIVVQVPSTLQPGLFNVQVNNSAGSSNTEPFMVTAPGCPAL